MLCQLPILKVPLLFDYSMNNTTLEHVKNYPYKRVILATTCHGWTTFIKWYTNQATLSVLFSVTSGTANQIQKRLPTWVSSAHSLSMPAWYGTHTTKAKIITLRWSSVMQSVEIIAVNWVWYYLSMSLVQTQLVNSTRTSESCTTHTIIQNCSQSCSSGHRSSVENPSAQHHKQYFYCSNFYQHIHLQRHLQIFLTSITIADWNLLPPHVHSLAPCIYTRNCYMITNRQFSTDTYLILFAVGLI